MVAKDCEHKFVFLRSAKWSDASGHTVHYTRIDMFFCEKCLERRQIRNEDYKREPPDWYRD